MHWLVGEFMPTILPSWAACRGIPTRRQGMKIGCIGWWKGQVSPGPRTPPLAGDKPQRYISLATLGCRCSGDGSWCRRPAPEFIPDRSPGHASLTESMTHKVGTPKSERLRLASDSGIAGANRIQLTAALKFHVYGVEQDFGNHNTDPVFRRSCNPGSRSRNVGARRIAACGG